MTLNVFSFIGLFHRSLLQVSFHTYRPLLQVCFLLTCRSFSITWRARNKTILHVPSFVRQFSQKLSLFQISFHIGLCLGLFCNELQEFFDHLARPERNDITRPLFCRSLFTKISLFNRSHFIHIGLFCGSLFYSLVGIFRSSRAPETKLQQTSRLL